MAVVEMLIWPAVSLGLSIWLLSTYHRARNADFRGWAAGWLLMSLFLACTFSWLNALIGVGLLFTASLMPANINPKTRLRIGVGVVVAMYLLAFRPGVVHLLQRYHARVKYPVQSLASRLEYEQETLGDPTAAFTTAVREQRSVSPTVRARWEKSNPEHNWYSERSHELRMLHNRNVDVFAVVSGFGVGRMPMFPPRLDLQLLEYGENALPRLIAAPALPDDLTLLEDTPHRNDARLRKTESHQESLLLMHDHGIARFLNPASLGYIAGNQRAAGFVSHRFGKAQLALTAGDSHRGWRITRLELVSLLKHKEPRVYVSAELPRMDKLKQVPTRELSEFEQQALTKLWYDEDVVVAEQPDQILMLGALRAQETCLKCHSVKAAQLLGAFSYELRPLRALPSS